MLRVFQTGKKETADKTTLYPRQSRPEGYARPQLAKQKQPVDLFDLLKKDAGNPEHKTRAGAAFATFDAVRKATLPAAAAAAIYSAQAPNGALNGTVPGRKVTATPGEFLTHWQTFSVAKRAEQESLARHVDAVLRNVNVSGFKQASQATNWRIKSFWLGLIFLLATIAIYEVVQCVRAYNQSPVVTKYTLLTPDVMDFPQVYLCYGSSFNRSYIDLHKDHMEIATAYRNRSAVTKGGSNRRKRDLSQTFSHDPNDIKALSDDDITRILLDSADHPTRELMADHHESGKWWKSGIWTQDGQESNDLLSEFEFDEVGADQTAELERGKRAAIDTEHNFTPNASQSAANANATAKAAAAARARRIEAMMNAMNISVVVYEYFREAAYRVEETFLECEFRSYKNEKLDCKEVIVPIMDANYGMCFLVNLPYDRKQTVAGHGLRLLLNSQVILYPRAKEGAPKYAGILVSVNKQYDPFNWLKSLAAPGHLTKIDLEASYVELLNLKSGPLVQPCTDDDTGSSQLRVFKGNYSRTLCQMDCLYQAHRNACNCILPVDKSQVKEEILNDITFCGPKQFKGCLANSADATDKAVNACRTGCYTPCKSYRYEMRSSSAKLNGPAFARLRLPPNVTADQLIELRVSYGRKEIVKLVQSPSASFSDMVSNVGGHFNLWLGASVITLLQLMFAAIGFLLLRALTKVRRSPG